jgi:tetratricopeptide (TPR) repeat protein
VLVLVAVAVFGLRVIHIQLGGTRWMRPFDPRPTPTRTAESHFDDGETLYDEGLIAEAIVAYRNAFNVDPQDNAALFQLARLMVIDRRMGEVLEQYGPRLRDEALGDARTLAVLGMALNRHARFNSEDLVPAYIELGILKDEDVQTEDWTYDQERVTRQLLSAAQKACEQALRLDPDLPEAHAFLAEALADQQRFEAARVAAQTAVDLRSDLPDAQRALAYVYEMQGQYEMAIPAYEAAIEAHPRLSSLHLSLGEAHRAVGMQLSLAGEWDASRAYFELAIVSFEEAIALDAADPRPYDEIGWTYGRHMGDDRALKLRGVDYLEQAIDQDPGYARAYYRLGQVYYELQNWEEAILGLEYAIELAELSLPDRIWAHNLLGWSYYVVDHNDKTVQDPCAHALLHFRAARDILDQLPQHASDLEMLTRQGLDACE